MEGYDGNGDPLIQGVVSATTAMSSGGPAGLGGRALAKASEAAMSKAIEDAAAEGITDPDVIRERMLAASHEVIQAARQAIEERITEKKPE